MKNSKSKSQEYLSLFVIILATFLITFPSGFVTKAALDPWYFNLVKPALDDTILDPTCGSGGFLSNCALYLDKEFKVNWSKQKEKFKGYDIAQDVVKLGLVNMLICTGELFTDHIQQKDTFRKSIEQKYDMELLLRFLVFRTLEEREMRKIGNDLSGFLTDKMVEMAKNENFDYS